MISAKTTVWRDIPAGMHIYGPRGMEIGPYQRMEAAFRRLPEALKEIRRLSERLDRLEREAGIPHAAAPDPPAGDP